MSTMILAPLPPGVTSVTSVDLFGDADHSQTAVASLPATLVGGRWTVDATSVPAGRYWPIVRALKGQVPYSYPHVLVDLPIDHRLVLSPEAVAKKAGIPLPLDDDQRETITDAILDAQADVEGYLRRPIMPVEQTDERLSDAFGDTWPLSGVVDADDEVTVLAVTPDAYGTFSVTYRAGLNARDDQRLRPIRRYLLAHAMNSPEVTGVWKATTKPKGDVTSLSADGQSVSFSRPTLGGGGQAGSGAPGALPTLGSLDTWRVRRVWQGRTRFGQPL